MRKLDAKMTKWWNGLKTKEVYDLIEMLYHLNNKDLKEFAKLTSTKPEHIKANL